MHMILWLKARAKYTQYGKLKVSVSLLTQIISLIPRREKKFREIWWEGKLNLFQINSCLTKSERDPYIEISRKEG